MRISGGTAFGEGKPVGLWNISGEPARVAPPAGYVTPSGTGVLIVTKSASGAVGSFGLRVSGNGFTADYTLANGQSVTIPDLTAHAYTVESLSEVSGWEPSDVVARVYPGRTTNVTHFSVALAQGDPTPPAPSAPAGFTSFTRDVGEVISRVVQQADRIATYTAVERRNDRQFYPAITWENMTPDTLYLSSNAYATSRGAGVCRVRGLENGVVKLDVTWEGATLLEAQTPTLAFATDTAAKACFDGVSSRVTADDLSILEVRKKIYDLQQHTTPLYIRGTGCWANGIVSKLTCISPWNSYSGTTRAGTAITKRHIVFADHYDIPLGTTIRFVGADNTVYNRQLVKSAKTNSVGVVSDIRVGLLESDLPDAIVPCKFLPATASTRFPNGLDVMPTLQLDQEEKALIGSVLSGNGAFSSSIISFGPSPAPVMSAFYEEKIGGDSGNPVFLILNGELVILTVWTGGGGGAGYNMANPAILQAVKDLIPYVDASYNTSTGYAVQEVNLSSYTAF